MLAVRAALYASIPTKLVTSEVHVHPGDTGRCGVVLLWLERSCDYSSPCRKNGAEIVNACSSSSEASMPWIRDQWRSWGKRRRPASLCSLSPLDDLRVRGKTVSSFEFAMGGRKKRKERHMPIPLPSSCSGEDSLVFSCELSSGFSFSGETLLLPRRLSIVTFVVCFPLCSSSSSKRISRGVHTRAACTRCSGVCTPPTRSRVSFLSCSFSGHQHGDLF